MRDLPLGPDRDPLRDAVSRMTSKGETSSPPPAEPKAEQRRTYVPPPTSSQQPKAASSDESHYLRLGGVWLSKKQVHAAIATDLPALLAELAQGKTLRAKFMNIVLAPLVKDYVLSILNGQYDGKDYSDSLP